ncbi:hypothetical protein C4573_03770 [Candidatus Woesearchaeota archaeon]|nr:MAG: hypothetical protein C4573_03770 [Candidatus Woesearchaeota archaeon]
MDVISSLNKRVTMKTKHIFVATLDINELFPFSVSDKKEIEEGLKDQQRVRQELEKFIGLLEKHGNQKIFYMGSDIIESKYYERFLFEKNGFLEVMMDKPVAVNAHFTEKKHAESFCKAIKKALLNLLSDTPVSKMFIDAIEVQTEAEQSLTYQTWEQIKDIRNK